MDSILHLLLLGDQTSSQYELLRDASIHKRWETLVSFLERVRIVIREEVHKLPATRREPFPDFQRISDLVEAYQASGKKIPQLESCLVTIAQLAHCIG
jgi:hypothetical protein